MADLKDERIKNHLLEPKGALGIHGKAYPADSMFKDVTIHVRNDKNRPIMVKLTETGLLIELVRPQ